MTDARRLLGGICGWFGRRTARLDLIEARTLLRQLRKPVGRDGARGGATPRLALPRRGGDASGSKPSPCPRFFFPESFRKFPRNFHELSGHPHWLQPCCPRAIASV